MTELQGPIYGRSVSDINDRGQVVGRIDGDPVLWEDGRPTRLWIAPGSNLWATDINDRGDIILAGDAGIYHGRAGQVHLLDPPGGEEALVLDLNESGQVLIARGRVGGSCCPLWERYEIWQDGVTTGVRVPPPPSGLAVRMGGLSDGGHVLVEYGEWVPFLDITQWQASGGLFVWHAGNLTQLTAGVSSGVAVNRNGQVVGGVGSSLWDLQLPSSGRLWSGGRTSVLGLYPTGINDRGQVVGRGTVNGQTHAVLWENGRVTDIGTPGADYGNPFAINERGQVLGRARAADGTERPYVWSNGRLIDLPSLGGPTYVIGLNDVGQAIGTVTTPPPASTPVPVMWTVHDDGGPIDPPAQECFTAPNRDHVQAGRATSWLIFTWATGSGAYIGLASQSTSLREAAAGSWEPVTSC